VEQKKSDKTINLEFGYDRGASYRNVHVSGVYGTILPNGVIYMAAFSERSHFPEKSTITIDSEGHPVAPENLVSTPGTIREVEMGLLFDLNTAMSMQSWLSARIEQMQKRQAELAEAEKKEVVQ
jgi:hypothetical protein